MTSIADVLERLEAALVPPFDPHSRYGSIALPAESDEAALDVLVQSTESTVAFALWSGADRPQSAGDDGFAEEAVREQLTDGTVLAWLEQSSEEDDEPSVRILVAFRPDGPVVTVNRYAGPDVDPSETTWSFDALREIALDPRWRNLAAAATGGPR